MASDNNSIKNKNKNNERIRGLLPAQEHFHMHFWTIFFILVFIYVLINLFIKFTSKDTGVYNVIEGSSGKVSEYRAFIIRDEKIYNADYSGFASFYASQGERVRSGSAVCTLDENGNFLSQLVTSSNKLSDESMKKLKSALYSVSISFDLNDYSAIYSEKNTIKNELLALLTSDSIVDNRNPSDQYTFDVVTTEKSGTFATGFDGYENFDVENFDKSEINENSYTLNMLKTGDLVTAGSPLYKIISSDSFSILIEMSKDDQVDFWFDKTIDVYFKELGRTFTGTYQKITDKSGNRYAYITFDEGGFLLANTRFSSVEVGTDVTDGLKIPGSALVTKDYLLLPKEYALSSGELEQKKCMVQYYENGKLQNKGVSINIIDSYNDDYYIISSEELAEGDVVIAGDDVNTYVLGAKQAIQGVYCINKGFAVFKRVNILSEDDEGFVIVQNGLSGSVVKNDRIALNGDKISEGEIVY